jgi:ferredoxin
MSVAPEVFELDDTDDLHILVDEVPEHLQAKVEQAIANCPKQALSAL